MVQPDTKFTGDRFTIPSDYARMLEHRFVAAQNTMPHIYTPESVTYFERISNAHLFSLFKKTQYPQEIVGENCGRNAWIGMQMTVLAYKCFENRQELGIKIEDAILAKLAYASTRRGTVMSELLPPEVYASTQSYLFNYMKSSVRRNAELMENIPSDIAILEAIMTFMQTQPRKFFELTDEKSKTQQYIIRYIQRNEPLQLLSMPPADKQNLQACLQMRPIDEEKEAANKLAKAEKKKEKAGTESVPKIERIQWPLPEQVLNRLSVLFQTKE